MSATLICSTGVKGPHNKRGQIRCKRDLPSFFASPYGGNLIPVIVRRLMGAGSLLLSRLGIKEEGWISFGLTVSAV